MRQAVVLIHGIGEQRPMSTARGFVEAVLQAAEQGRSQIFSKPDRMAETFELRRLVAEKSSSRPMTDFYEYYWAYHMQGTKLRHLWPWLRTILLRPPSRVPSKLRVIWVLSWMLALGAGFFFLKSRFSPDSVLGRGSSWTSLALAGLFLFIQGFAISSVGDAARYLSPLPSNIAIRQKIRSEGIDLLRRLHGSGRYDRVILVGHSLGSVIGYDILTHLWSQYNEEHAEPERSPQPALSEVERLGKQLDASPSPKDLEEFRKAQRRLWIEQRSLAFPWLITDFVTLGSPLAHAAILLARDAGELRTRQEQRELPRCPPATDKNRIWYRHDYRHHGVPRTIRVLDHAALFAPTRWSNIYFPVRFGLLGDLVGGPMRPIFGSGILDIPVTDGLVRFAPLLPHTHYWRGAVVPKRQGRTCALGALCDVLALDSRDWLPRPGRPPGPSRTGTRGKRSIVASGSTIDFGPSTRRGPASRPAQAGPPSSA